MAERDELAANGMDSEVLDYLATSLYVLRAGRNSISHDTGGAEELVRAVNPSSVADPALQKRLDAAIRAVCQSRELQSAFEAAASREGMAAARARTTLRKLQKPGGKRTPSRFSPPRHRTISTLATATGQLRPHILGTTEAPLPLRERSASWRPDYLRAPTVHSPDVAVGRVVRGLRVVQRLARR